MSVEADLRLENGLTVAKLAASMQRVFWICTRGRTSGTYTAEETADLLPDAGWLHAAAIAISYYAASGEDNITLTVTQLAQQLRNSYYRGCEDAGEGPAGSPPEFDSLSARHRLAWEMVARFAAGTTNADEEEVERLEGFEPAWGDLLVETAARRNLNLEQPEPE